jgi:HSP20 family molecular chaperone IbpA
MMISSDFLSYALLKNCAIDLLFKGEFRPEELNVKVEGRMLVVKGDRQVKVGNATESKQFNRELTIPEFVDVKTVQSYLSGDGMLTVEAPVIMDRVYHNNTTAAITPASSYQQSSPGRVLDTTFSSDRPLLSSNFGSSGNNQSNSYSTTSSTSSFRQESSGAGLGNSSIDHRSSPLRDQYSSTSSASTLTGGGGGGGMTSSYSNQAPVSSSMASIRPLQSINDRYDGVKNVTYDFDLHEFKPEDISIQVNDLMLKVSALRRECASTGSSHREFKREIGRHCI